MPGGRDVTTNTRNVEFVCMTELSPASMLRGMLQFDCVSSLFVYDWRPIGANALRCCLVHRQIIANAENDNVGNTFVYGMASTYR